MEWTLVINHHLITVIREPEYCDKCWKEGQMRLLVKKNDQQTYYCQTCSLNLLEKLEQSNYQFTSKETIINELRTADHYSCKKLTCIACVNLGISQKEYQFCYKDCLVNSWVRYQGFNYLRNHE